MPHRKLIKDKDPCFVIDANTRTIKKQTVNRKTLMQYDHNSERFSFLIPKSIEGHDMMDCNKVEVHYINIDALTMEQFSGVYTVTDLQADTEDAAMLKCSWLISQNATKLSGSLNFLLRFSCVAEDGTIEYAWNTEIFTGISVTSGIYNSEVIVEQYADVLEQWKKELENSGSGGGGGGGAVSSVNGKVGDVVLSANDVEAYSQIPGINITGGGIEIHSNSDKNIILFTHRDDGSFAVHDLSQKADKATTLSGYGITDAYNKTEVNDKLLAIDGRYKTAEYSDIDSLYEPCIYHITDNDKHNGWLLVTHYTEEYEDHHYGPMIGNVFCQLYFHENDNYEGVLEKRTATNGRWTEWESIGNGSVDLSNVSDEAFLDKLNAVLPDGDEVSY